MTLRAKLAIGSACALLVIWVAASYVVYSSAQRATLQRIDDELERQRDQLEAAEALVPGTAGDSGEAVLAVAASPAQQQVIQLRTQVTQQRAQMAQLRTQIQTLKAAASQRLAAAASRTQAATQSASNANKRTQQALALAASLPSRLAQRELIAQVRDNGGDIIMQSLPLQEIGDLPTPSRAVPSGAGVEETVSVSKQRLRMLSYRGDDDSTVQLALPLDDADAWLERLRTMLGVAALIAALLAAIAGIIIARAALRPVAAIARTARHIGDTGDLTQHVPAVDARDEIGVLSRTFKRMLEQLNDAREAQKRFVADASHELRTPLTSLRGNVEFIARPTLSEADRDDTIRELIGDVDRLDDIAEDLLMLARMDAMPQAPREPSDIAAVVRAVVDRHRASLAPRTVDATFDVPPTFAADSRLVDRAVSNLLVNIVRYTPGDTDVYVRALADTTGDGIRIEVEDTGPGMAPDDAAHAFDRFHRGASAHEIDGTGLGLAIVSEVARVHGGEATVHSELGKGTTFTLTLAAGA